MLILLSTAPRFLGLLLRWWSAGDLCMMHLCLYIPLLHVAVQQSAERQLQSFAAMLGF